MKRFTTAEFILEVKRRNPRCYKLTFKNTVYRGRDKRIWFHCYKHGEVSAIAQCLLRGRSGCPKCGWERMAKKKRKIWNRQSAKRWLEELERLTRPMTLEEALLDIEGSPD